MYKNLNSEIFYSYVIKEVNNKYYLYAIETNSIYELDDESYKVFHDLENIKKYPEVFKFAKKNFLLRTKENNVKIDKLRKKLLYKKKNSNPTGLTLMVSQKCNLRCKYCYGDGGEYSNKGEMTFDIAKKTIDYFVENSKADELSICFFGGEPLMNLPLIKQCIEYIHSIKDKKISLSMTTNGTLINEEIKKIIVNNNISLTISLDGDKKTTDTNRYNINKVGIYDKVVANITDKDIKKRTVVRATIAPPNLDIQYNIHHLVQELNINKVAWAEADNLLSDDNYNEIISKYFKLISDIEDYIKKEDFKKAKQYYMYLGMVKKFSSDGIRIKGCGAGNNLIAVDIDGKIYPCHRFVGMDNYVIGNINTLVNDNNSDIDKNKQNYFNEVTINNFKKCQNCFAKNICGGSCVNQNYYSTGKINEPSEKYCNYIKKIVERAFETYILIKEKNAVKQLL